MATASNGSPLESFHIALTGHRPQRLAGYDLSQPFYTLLQRKLSRIIEAGLEKHKHLTLHSGMALGADTVWSLAILEARDLHPAAVRFVAEVPSPEQAGRWRVADRKLWEAHVAAADEVNYYAEKYHVSCLWKRNNGMVAACDLLLAVWDGSESGGTFGAIEYARKREKQVFVIDPESISRKLLKEPE